MARIFVNDERPHSEFNNILKVKDINPGDYKNPFTHLGFKKYEAGVSLEDNFKKYEPAICSFNSCGKELSLRQQLAGDRCEDHPKESKMLYNLQHK